MAISGLRRLFRLAVRPVAVEQEVDAELQFHLETEAARLMALGMRSDAARQEARRRFGDLRFTREVLVMIDQQRRGRERRAGWFEDLRQDLAYAFRGFRRQPGFAALVVGTLALGIGANTTMFGIIDRLLLRPPAFLAEPATTSRLFTRRSQQNSEDRIDNNISYKRYRELRAGAASVHAAAFFVDRERVVGTGEAARQLPVSLVSASFWSFFSVRPALGRFFTDAEDHTPDGSTVAVLGYGLWQTSFGGDRGVVGKQLYIGARPYAIIGVAPRGFSGMSLGAVAAFIPITAAGHEMFGDMYFTGHHVSWMEMIVRRKPGVSVEVAEAELTRAYQASRTAEGRVRVEAVARSRVELGSSIWDRGPKRSESAQVATWLAAVAAILLLIVCANVANLMLARALRRRREIAVRLALGAGRRRLLRQLLTESTGLALLGGAAGLALAHFGGGVLRSALITEVDWSSTPVFDTRVLLFTGAIALLTGMLTGLAPVFQAGRADVTGALKQGGREGSRQHARLRSGLLVLQAALSVVLLVGAGLFVRSLRNANAVDLGYEPSRMLFVTTDLRAERLTPAAEAQLKRRLLDAARATPGVVHAGLTGAIPFWMSWTEDLFVPGRDSLSGLGTFYLNRVSSDYFATTGTGIVLGRDLADADSSHTPGPVVVSETMARRVWPGQSALGQCIKVGADTVPCSEVVGIAHDVRWGSLGDDDRMQLYLPIGASNRGAIFVRTAGAPEAIAEPLRRALQRLMPGTAFVTVGALESTLEPQLRPWRLGATMFTIFGLLALVVAAIGLYGVIAYSVTQRLHEMGIRVALGAKTSDVLRLVVGEGVRVALIGIVLGAAGAFAAGKLIASLLFGVPARDPLTFGVVALVLLLTATLASLIPALRASRVDPNLALRTD
jgi:putative ABC transport system permease protein